MSQLNNCHQSLHNLMVAAESVLLSRQHSSSYKHSVATILDEAVTIVEQQINYNNNNENNKNNKNKSITQVFSDIIKSLLSTIDNESLLATECLLLVCQLVRGAIDTGLSHVTITIAYKSVAKLLIDALEQTNILKLNVSLSNRTVINNFLSTILIHYCTSLQSSVDSQLPISMAEKVRRAFVLSTMFDSTDSVVSTPLESTSITYEEIVGPPFESTLLMPLCLLLRLPQASYLSEDLKLRHVVVALFDCSLELPTVMTGASAVEVTQHFQGNVISFEHKVLEEFAQTIKAAKITLVGCQKRVHPYLQLLLCQEGVACLPRMSVKYMSALQRHSGAKPFTNLVCSFVDGKVVMETLADHNFGYLSSLEHRSIYGVPFLIAQSFDYPSEYMIKQQQDSQSVISRDAIPIYLSSVLSMSEVYVAGVCERIQPISTIAVTAFTSPLAQELATGMMQAHLSLKRLLNHPYLTPSAGFWQIYLADLVSLSYPRLHRRLPKQDVVSNILICGKHIEAPSIMDAGSVNNAISAIFDTLLTQGKKMAKESYWPLDYIVKIYCGNSSNESVLAKKSDVAQSSYGHRIFSESESLDSFPNTTLDIVSGPAFISNTDCIELLKLVFEISVRLLEVDSAIYMPPEEVLHE